MKILIVDDEAPARDRLRRLLEDAGEHVVAGEAADGQKALAIAANIQPDVVLLDIRMPGIDGIETARHLNKLDRPPVVIFTTAYDEYAIEAFEANAIGYVLKPVRWARLETALAQAARLNSSVLVEIGEQVGGGRQRKHVCAHTHGELKLISINEIAYFIADQKYVCVVYEDGRELIDDSLKALELEFDEQFVRINRGTLVSLRAVDALRKTDDGRTQVMLRDRVDADELFVSRRHVADVKRRLKRG